MTVPILRKIAFLVDKNEVKITVCDVPDKPGEASRIFEKLAKSDINVDMIVQNISRTRSTDISYTVTKSDLEKTRDLIERISRQIGAKGVKIDKNIAKVSIVGIGMRSHSGVAAKMFKAMAENNINIEMISTSEIKISCVVSADVGRDALRVIHKAFGLDKEATVIEG